MRLPFVLGHSTTGRRRSTWAAGLGSWARFPILVLVRALTTLELCRRWRHAVRLELNECNSIHTPVDDDDGVDDGNDDDDDGEPAHLRLRVLKCYLQLRFYTFLVSSGAHGLVLLTTAVAAG